MIRVTIACQKGHTQQIWFDDSYGLEPAKDFAELLTLGVNGSVVPGPGCGVCSAGGTHSLVKSEVRDGLEMPKEPPPDQQPRIMVKEEIGPELRAIIDPPKPKGRSK